MIRSFALFLVLLLAGSAPGLAGEDPGPADRKAPDAGESPDRGSKEGSAKPGKKPATPLRRILKELKALVARAKARPDHDAALLAEIEKLIRSFEKEAKKPVKLEDLSEADRKKLEQEVREKIAKERREAPGGGGGADWISRARKRAVDRALEGVELEDEQRKKVEEMLSGFAEEAWSAWSNRDYKVLKELKNDLEKRLKKEVGYRKARRIMNNVNKQFSSRRR